MEYEASLEDSNNDYVNKFAPEIAWVLTFCRDTIGVFVRKIYQLLSGGDLINTKNIALKSWKIATCNYVKNNIWTIPIISMLLNDMT